jgi:two-component system LytT family sensor kinase
MHAPVLVNTLGHFAGTVVFGILLYYLVLDWRRERTGSLLPSFAATLALLWNVGSLIGLATADGGPVSDTIVAASFSVLSLLPAILLHISHGPRRSPLVLIGYAVSGGAMALHTADLITNAARFHYAAILLVTLGFAALATVELTREVLRPDRDGSGKRLAIAMVLFLLAISFAHFRSNYDSGGWSGEAALHHAAIPLALFVLLQDYRFVLADAFIRFLTSAVLAALTIWLAWSVHLRFPAVPGGDAPFQTGALFIAGCVLISLFAHVQAWLQRTLTRVVFLRHSADAAVASLRSVTVAAASESEMLQKSLRVTANAFSAARAELSHVDIENVAFDHASPVIESRQYGLPGWVWAIVPLRFSRGDACCFLFGARAGGRRYLSEDLALLDRLGAVVCERIEHLRHSEMQALVSQAELRALQAQINPHFFFNALNTLYGVIPRESARARRLVLNLAELFRVSFTSERTLIRVEEEVRIVRAYLEIEQLRLGDKLRSEISVDPLALATELPVLSIQPLVENAVKHGVASRTEGGFVSLAIELKEDRVVVTIANSGSFRADGGKTRGTGVGLTNVRQRLALCFGLRSELTVESTEQGTTVSFSVPAALEIRGSEPHRAVSSV